jgi:hypothetical protein
MDRWDVVFLAGCLLGLALVATAPSEPIYSMSISQSVGDSPAETTDFVDLQTDAQQEFLALLADEAWRSSDPPALENGVVRYKGGLYRVHVSVSESSVFSLLQPVLGGALALLGALGFVARRTIRRYRS